MIRIKAQTVQSEETRRHLRDAHRRLMSVAAVQQHLQASGRGDCIEVAPYLSKLCGILAASLIGDRRPVSLEARVEGGSVSSSAAASLGVIVTELVMNALKHAFPGDKSDGQVIVAYDVVGTSWKLSVSDNGIGRSVDSSGRTPQIKPGLGMRIVKALADQLEARFEVSSNPRDGTIMSLTHATFTSPMPRAA